MTPPDVRRGEQVMIYQFADSDGDYYWNTLRNDLSMRKLETVVYAISGTQAEGAAVDASSSYVMGISSHQKKLWITTSKANGEPFAYGVTFDLAAGNIMINDDIGNYFTLDSQNHILHLQNAEGSFIDLNKEILSIFTGDQINLKTNAFSINTQTYSLNATTSITSDTPASTIKSTTTTLTSTTQHVGDLTVAGDFNTIAGPSGQEGQIMSNANFTTSQNVQAANVTATQTVKALTIDGQNYENLPG